MATLGQAYVQIMPSAQGISGSISKILDPEARSAGNSAGGQIGNSLISSITKVIAAAGIGKLIKDGLTASLSAGADIQQSFGGLDTLYKGAQKEIKQYAADAYKAGISANTYAENATAFGASLKQALGGDAVAAAKAANTAIMDMADNSAKMGTDMALVQQTYQSLARGNYAMLDNLKLGYGGTKSEMERLLADAEKLPKAMGKKFDLSNFSDVVEAIHLVQDNLGLAGVAAEEAKTTFSGSLQAMKSSFTNVLAALSSGEMDITPQLKGLAETTANFLFGNFIPMVGNIIKGLPSALGTFFDAAKAQILPRLQSFLDAKGIKFDLSKLSLGGLSGLSGKLIAGIGAVFASTKIFSGFKLPNPFTGLLNMAKSAGLAIKNSFSGIGQGLASAFRGIGTAISTVFTGIARAISMLNPVGIAAFAMGLAAVSTALVALSAVQGMVLPFLQGLADVFVQLVSGVLQAFVAALISLSPVLSTIASALVTLAPLVTAFGSAFAQIATAIGGAVTQILAVMPPLVTAIAGGISQIVTAITPIVEIISGAFVQIVTVISQAIVQIVQAIAPFIPAITEMVAVVAPSLASIIASFSDMFAQISPIIDSITQLVGKLGDSISKVFESAGGVIESFGTAVSGILDSVRGIIKEVGDSFTKMGNSLVKIAQNAGGLAAAAAALVAMAAAIVSLQAAFLTIDLRRAADDFAKLSNAVKPLGTAMQLVTTSSQVLGSSMSMFVGALSRLSGVVTNVPLIFEQLKANLGSLPGVLITVSTAMASFVGNVKTSVMGLTIVSSTITNFATVLMTIGPASVMASAGLSAFNSQANNAGNAMQRLGLASSSALGQVTALGTGIMSSMANATASINNAGLQMTATIRSAGSQMSNAMQVNMAQIKTIISGGMTACSQIVRSGGSQITNAIKQSGNHMVSSWRTSGQQMISTTANTVNQIRNNFGTLGSINLYAHGAAVMNSFLSGLHSRWGAVQGFVSQIASWIRANKGPISYDKVLLKPAGRAIMQGLDSSLKSGFKDVMGTVSGMADAIASPFDLINFEFASTAEMDMQRNLTFKNSAVSNSNDAGMLSRLSNLERLMSMLVDKELAVYLDGEVMAQNAYKYQGNIMAREGI
ncbi:TPA: hypothetical protein U1Z92_000503 [Streptococcus suis]|nr:hypothetical protein [Streptococcus suis]